MSRATADDLMKVGALVQTLLDALSSQAREMRRLSGALFAQQVRDSAPWSYTMCPEPIEPPLSQREAIERLDATLVRWRLKLGRLTLAELRGKGHHLRLREDGKPGINGVPVTPDVLRLVKDRRECILLALEAETKAS